MDEGSLETVGLMVYLADQVQLDFLDEMVNQVWLVLRVGLSKYSFVES